MKSPEKFGGFIFLLYLCSKKRNKQQNITTMKTLYNNYNINYSAWFGDFEEHCILNGIDHTQYNEDSEYFYEWVQDTLAMEWDDLLTNIKCDMNNNVDCVVLGTVGRWNGNFEIQAKHFPTLRDAIIACVENCDYIVVTEDEGAIKVFGVHHDNNNYFTIHKLNEKGYDANACGEDLNNEEFFDKFNIEW